MNSGYDVIGDLHGEAGALKRLLASLGYAPGVDGAFRHDGARQVVFVGDFIDRGPEQVEVLDIAKRMIEAGTAYAVMGNHELNAIAWATPDGLGSHMRVHSDKNRRQHARFLEQIGENSRSHRDAVAFFRTLPLWFEVPGLRVVHACWHPASIDLIRPSIDVGARLKADAWPLALAWKAPFGEAVEVLTKGPEIQLPGGRTFFDKDGHERSAVRVKWWDPQAVSYRTAGVSIPGDDLDALPDLPLEEDFGYREDVPVIFGHYWMTGDPRLTDGRAACVDFSVAKPDGSLVAYRWSGERTLSDSNLVHVPAMEMIPAPDVSPAGP